VIIGFVVIWLVYLISALVVVSMMAIYVNFPCELCSLIEPYGVDLVEKSWDLAVCSCPRSQVRLFPGANNSMGPSDLGKSP